MEANFVSKPENVVAKQVTETNFNEIAAWCNGTVRNQAHIGEDSKLFIEMVQTDYLGHSSRTMVFVDDWVVLHGGSRFMMYIDQTFRQLFTDKLPLNAVIAEYLAGAVFTNRAHLDWDEEEVKSYCGEVALNISAHISKQLLDLTQKDTKRILELVKDSMVGAIGVMTSPNLTSEQQSDALVQGATDITMKILGGP